MTKCTEVSSMYSLYEVMPHGADRIAACNAHHVVQSCGIPTQRGCLLGLQEWLREAMLHVGFNEADVRADNGSQWDLYDETLNSAGILPLVFTAI